MSIEIHCSQCNKLIKAPDNAGGKRGKCPYCSNSVYIPMPHDDDDVIGLAPIDEAEEQRAEKERRVAARYASEVAHGTDAGPDNTESSSPSSKDSGTANINVEEEVENFLRAMGTSSLDDAEAAVTRLNRAGKNAKQHIKDQNAEDLAALVGGIPVPVVKGFLKTLLGRLK